MSFPRRSTAFLAPFQPTRHALATALCLASMAAARLAHAQTEPPAQTPPDTTLPAVKVRAAAERATTEGSGSYTTPKVTIGKTEQSIRAIPQPVTVISHQWIEDRKVTDLHDLLQSTPGVQVDYTDTERVNFNSRGYSIDALMIDGLPISQGGSVFIQPDTAAIDRVEVLRGASGMLRGSGNPSGAVNMVRKRPKTSFEGSGALTYGSWNRQRAEADVSTPINDAGTVRGRIVGVLDHKEFFQKIREEDRKVIYGVLEADLGPRTRLTGSWQHTELDATGAWGNVPRAADGTVLDLPRDLYLGASWNRWNRYNQQAYAELEHRFDNDWTLRFSTAGTRLRMQHNGFKQSYFSRPSNSGVYANPYIMDVSSSVYTGDASDQRAFNVIADGPFKLLGRTHQFVFGADAQRVKTTPTVGAFNLNPLTAVDIRNWDPNAYPEPFPTITGTPTVNVIEQKGAYATTRLSITDPLAVSLGARASWWKYRIPSQPASASNYSMSREITPYLGVVYDLSDKLSAYTSYSEIFTPQNVYDASGQLLAPIRGKSHEAGIKGEWFDGKLNAQLAFFRIENVGKAVEDTSSPNPCTPVYTTGYCRMAGGETRSEGFEAEVAGELLPRLQVLAGYTNTRTRIVRDTSASATGQPLRAHDPRHQLRLSGTYRLGGALQGWKVGGGVNAQSDGYNTGTFSGTTATVRQGGYSIYNAMVGYVINENLALQLNINNLTDKVYFKKYAATGISNYYGDPRNAMLTLSGTW